MFETFVLICSISNPNMCHTLSDTYGPYDSKKQCIQRAYEIGEELPNHMPDYVAVKYKCFKTEESKGKVRTQWHMKTDEQLY